MIILTKFKSPLVTDNNIKNDFKLVHNLKTSTPNKINSKQIQQNSKKCQ